MVEIIMLYFSCVYCMTGCKQSFSKKLLPNLGLFCQILLCRTGGMIWVVTDCKLPGTLLWVTKENIIPNSVYWRLQWLQAWWWCCTKGHHEQAVALQHVFRLSNICKNSILSQCHGRISNSFTLGQKKLKYIYNSYIWDIKKRAPHCPKNRDKTTEIKAISCKSKSDYITK